jgi:hypothetical protein
VTVSFVDVVGDVPEPELEATPVPLSGTESTVTPFTSRGREPENVPAEVGVNTTLKVRDPFALISRVEGTSASSNPGANGISGPKVSWVVRLF